MLMKKHVSAYSKWKVYLYYSIQKINDTESEKKWIQSSAISANQQNRACKLINIYDVAHF